MSKQNIFRFGGLIVSLSLFVSGCNSEPEATFREAGTAFHNLVETLQPVHDAGTAEASLAVLDDRYGAVIEVLKRMPEIQVKYKNAMVSTAVVDAIKREGAAFQL